MHNRNYNKIIVEDRLVFSGPSWTISQLCVILQKGHRDALESKALYSNFPILKYHVTSSPFTIVKQSSQHCSV